MDRQRLLAIGVSLALLLPVAAPAAESSVLFVLDGSGSMQAKVSGRPKIEVARAVMSNLMKSLPANVRVGLETYGHNRKDDCNDIEILVPVGSNHAAVIKAVNSINPKGKTPLTGAIQLAAAQFREHEGDASVVVVSDGKETCEGDPCAAVREAMAEGVRLKVHVVGFDVAPEEAEQLKCIAQAGNGQYFPAASAEELGKAFAQVKKEVITPPPPAKPTKKQVLFEDKFDRDELGETYEVLNPDPNRLATAGGSLVIAAALRPEDSPAPLNLALLQKTFSGDFIATVTVTVEVKEGIRAGLFYYADPQNFIFVGPWGRQERAHGGNYLFRRPVFSKVLGGQWDNVALQGTQLQDRQLEGELPSAETWYLQLRREGVKYTGRISVDGAKWADIGAHLIVQKGGRLGLGAYQDWKGGNEHAAEFSNFVVEGSE